ncbi:MAG: hypothetical protein WCE54_15510, partial [Ignavibacteriaceae bacterium]
NFSYINAFSERKGANILFDFNTPDGGSVKFNNFFNQVNTDNFESRVDTNYMPMYIFNDIETKQKYFFHQSKAVIIYRDLILIGTRLTPNQKPITLLITVLLSSGRASLGRP